jgi:hypothetical protein
VGAVAELHFFLDDIFPRFNRQTAVSVRSIMSAKPIVRTIVSLGFVAIASAALPIATPIDIGVARPSAQGQAMMRT